jgi:UDP-N-acetylmuramyl pentapeptide synthase
VVLEGDTVIADGKRLPLEFPFASRHQPVNALAAVAAARGLIAADEAASAAARGDSEAARG